MLKLYKIGVGRNELAFDMLCVKNTTIDKAWITSERPIELGWWEVWVCSQLLLKGPSNWFIHGDMNCSINVYENVEIKIKSFVEGNEWFHGTEPKLHMAGIDGKEIEIIAMQFSDSYVK